MDKKTLAKMILFILVWVNAFLAQHKLKTIPVLDETQVAMALAFAYSAYEWLKHAIKWIKDNWVKKQPDPAPVPVSVPEPTPTAVDITLPAAPVNPVAQAQTVESTTVPEQPQPPVQQ